MKQSYYNVGVPLKDGSTVLYNTRSRAIVELSSEEAQALSNIDSYPDDNPLVNSLAQEGFLVEDPETQADYLKYEQHFYRNGSTVFELTISPTRECNFDCNYCYILKRPGKMSEETQDAVLDFIEYNYNESPFQKLKIIWYGGEPLLAIDVIERLSAKMMDFCAENGIEYLAHALTNGSLADERMCERLVKCGFVSLMPTISGNGAMQDYQRSACDGRPRFDTLMQNIDHMRDAGLLVHVNFVVNENNFDGCCELVSKMCADYRAEQESCTQNGCEYCKGELVTRLTRAFPFGKDFIPLNDGKDTPMKLYERKDFGDKYLEFHRAQNLDAKAYAEVIKPIRLYCAAYVNRSFFIDEIGDIYACMEDMDYADKIICNVAGWQEGPLHLEPFLAFASLDPMDDPKCRSCRILPICQGGCASTRLKGGDACHDIKECIEDLVLDYYKALLTEEKEQG